jgi:hypothetical protein
LRSGDTGIGYTLETLLGIKENSSKRPDFEGIELKSKRLSSSTTKSGLFSQVADFQCSAFRSYEEVLDEFGYEDTSKNRLALKVTLNNKPFAASGTGKHLFLSVAEDDSKLFVSELLATGSSRNILEWQMSYLKWRLETKHAETFWIDAETKKSGKAEKFRYVAATHTQSPFVENLPLLLATGTITLDLTAHRDFNPDSALRNHGMNFKINKRDFGALFPPSFQYDLLSGTSVVR